MTVSLGLSQEQDGVSGNGRLQHGERAAGSRPDGAQPRRRLYVVTTAEQAECNCPEFCERDHEND